MSTDSRRSEWPPYNPDAKSLLDHPNYGPAMSAVFLDAFDKPREAVTRASSMLDEQMLIMWREFNLGAVEEFASMTYAEKVKAYCDRPYIGPDICRTLQTLGMVRNQVAHDWEIADFDDPKIASMIDSLPVPDFAFEQMAEAMSDDQIGMTASALEQLRPSRWSAAVFTAIFFFHMLIAHKPADREG